jgi:hypothetical protein
MNIMKINDLQGEANFEPRAMICTILVEVNNTVFHGGYLTSSLFREEFLSIYYRHIGKTYDPQRGANFDTKGKI